MGRLPERDTRAGATKGGIRWRPSNAMIAVVFLLIFTVGPYLAFTKHIPFTSYGYELKATFANGVNIAKNSPVRIAGVDVGKVISTERDGEAATVTFTVTDKGRPIHDDAFAQIRPRIFLEGNFFVDLEPGTPGAPEIEDEATIPINQTAVPVQFDQLLTSLQSDTREDLKVLLREYSSSLKGAGARGFNRSIPYWEPAYRDTAIVADAMRGETGRDLSGYV
ncbi:MAG TPA: MlaD family protein, partial [Solirubrobacterales bacterium]|nr:MlaD family protein [Solirubrobacterales bacterium]